LRLIPEDLDLAQLLDDLYREQVAGVYVPEDAVLYVGGGARDPSPLQRSILAHEITHALQDQHFDLAGFVDLPDERADEQLARIALVEGDATLTQQLWALEHLTGAQQGELLDEAFAIDTAVLDSAPEAIARSLSFPYIEGAQFAVALFQQGGMAALDDAFANPPTTTEHILHPDRYLAGEPAVAVQTASSPGDGWSEIERGGLGEFDVQLIFDPLGRADAAQVADGWGGGELAAWDRDGDLALAVSLAFDSAADATEACQAIPRWYSEPADASSVGAGVLQSNRDWLAFTCSGDRVAFGLGPDEATARALVAG
ncbi:MAG TPA: hypothetical protein VML96_03380, partial [Egibacteraceae bacterium]|nr:hypothetical protein [Egibacteraceae bacterium]